MKHFLFLSDTILSEVKQEKESDSLTGLQKVAFGEGLDQEVILEEEKVRKKIEDMSSFHHPVSADSDAGLQYRLQGTFTRWDIQWYVVHEHFLTIIHL